MKKNLSNIYIGIAIVLLTIFILDSTIVVERTEVFIPNIDEVLLDNDFSKIEGTDIFEKDVLSDFNENYHLDSMAFDLNYNYYIVRLKGESKSDYFEYTMIAYYYSENKYTISYHRSNENGITDRVYLYCPNDGEDLTIISSDFEEDLCAKTDSEKKLFFEDLEELFYEEIKNLDLSYEDFINWSNK